MSDMPAEAMKAARDALRAPLHKPQVVVNTGGAEIERLRAERDEARGLVGKATAMMNRVRDETGICPICGRSNG
jgi:hypothetical protein